MPISDSVTTRVRRQASIGAHATVVCGITIGKDALIAAGAKVLGDVHTMATDKKTQALNGVVKEMLGQHPPRQKTGRLKPARKAISNGEFGFRMIELIEANPTSMQDRDETIHVPRKSSK